MWKKLLGLARDVFDLRRQVKGHDKRLDDYSLSQENLNLRVNQIADRVLRLELELRHTKEQHAREVAHLQEQQAAERQIFHLQLETLVLRLQQGLPASSPTQPLLKDSTTQPPKDDETAS